jgi:hypothetical protein
MKDSFSRVKRLMIAVSLFSILFSLPRFFEIQTVWKCTETGCELHVTRTELTHSKPYWITYHIVFNTLFITFGPCLVLFILTLRISLALQRAGKRRKSLCQATVSDYLLNAEPRSNSGDSGRLSSTSTKDHKANVMLALVISKFLISDLLPTIADVLEHVGFVINRVVCNTCL